MSRTSSFGHLVPTDLRGGGAMLRYAFILAAVAIVYFLLAKLGLRLASINPSASPIWPPSGWALAAVLLWGLRVWPAVLLAAFAVNLTTTGSIGTSFAIGLGSTLECLVTGYLIHRWSGGRATFDTPIRFARFASLCLSPGALIGATFGVLSLALGGFAAWAQFGSIWLTWWLGDAANMLVIAPVIVLWANAPPSSSDRGRLAEIAALLAATIAVGIVAFSPLIEQTAVRGPLSFLAVVPLILAALRHGPRDTATVALILACFAVWGAQMDGGPFARTTLNDFFLLLLAFIVSTSVPSMLLSADVAMRRRTEDHLHSAQDQLDQRVQQRTAELARAIESLQGEVEERKDVENELQQQRVHLIEAQRLAVLGSWVWDVEAGKVSWSQQLFDIYGTKPEDFSGTFDDFLARVHDDDRERVKDQITQGFMSGQSFRLDERIVRPNGEIRYLQSSGEVIKNDRGEPVRMLGICQDVTDRKNAERALDEAREQLAQSQKLEALGQLTGGIAHDFNNLLMIVSGHAQILRGKLSDEKQLRSIDAIGAAASRGGNLTRQLLAFSRRQPLSPVVVDLKECVEAVREMLGSSLRDDIELTCDMPDGLWPTEVDLGELELALVNLAVNARDAMPEGGKITLSARNVTLKPNRGRGDGAGNLSGDFVALAMADTGVGIPDDVLPKVFEPFFTTKVIGKGTGLGLSQVYGFAHQTGGAVGIESKPGRGTTIILHLPRSRAPLSAEPDDADATRLPPGEGTVLMVEDNQAVAEVTSMLLTEIGYRVLRVDSAAEALARLQQDSVDLVFSDIVMPGPMNGIALAREIRSRYPQIPVLLTSGYSDLAQDSEIEFSVLRKPFQSMALEKSVREALQRARAGNQSKNASY